MKTKGNILVAQGGGPTVVINQSLVGVVFGARRFDQIGQIYGALNGVRGIINEDFLDLSQETNHHLECVANTSSSALLSTRDKPDQKYCQEIFNVLRAHKIHYFFYIGGNDSSDTVRLVNDFAKQAEYHFCAVHIPKTIDNDLVANDHTPGFGSAARFVAEAFKGANLDNRSLPGVYIGVVMGRHAGFLTASSSLAKKYSDDGPHLIYLPERPFQVGSFLSDVQAIYHQYGRCVVAVSEGICNHAGVPIITTLMKTIEKDQHGNLQLSGTGALGDLLGDEIRKHLKISRVRSDTFGYLQRSFSSCISDVDQQEARAVGEKGALWGIGQEYDCSVTIQRIKDYAVEYIPRPLEEIAGKTRLMPDEFINAQNNNVTDAFLRYCKPLIGSNFLEAYRLEAPKIDKILK